VSAKPLKPLECSWQVRLLIKKRKKKFTEEDVVRPAEEHESKRLGDKIENLWNSEENSSKIPSLTRVLVKMFAFRMILYGMVYLIPDLAVW
jgi:hypothetical protein